MNDTMRKQWPSSRLLAAAKTGICATAATMLLSGCALVTTIAESASRTPEPTHADTVIGYAGGVVAVRDAYRAAGGDCDEWVQTNQVTNAIASGTCDDDAVLMVFVSETERDDTINGLRLIAQDGVHLIVGENWLINTPDAVRLAVKLGGTSVTISSAGGVSPPRVTIAEPIPEPTTAPVETQPAADTETASQRQAIRKAEQYLSFTAFSREGLIGQLEFEGFATVDAEYAVDNITVNWNEQAALKAQDYLDYTSFSRSALIDQLVFEGFTYEQAEHGVSAVGL